MEITKEIDKLLKDAEDIGWYNPDEHRNFEERIKELERRVAWLTYVQGDVDIMPYDVWLRREG